MAKKPFKRTDDPFEDFDHMFEDMQRRMDALFGIGIGPTAQRERPRVVSYTRYETPDEVRGPDESDNEREGFDVDDRPLIDVNERGDKVVVLMQLPGVSKEDIDLTISGKTLHVAVDNEDRTVNEDIGLPCSVRPSTIKASYRNGVLEVVVDKSAPKKRKGKKVTIE